MNEDKRKHHRALQGKANTLAKYGQGEDKILAHINPEEASFLADNAGMSINPYTGLPQFGFFKSVFKGAKKVFKKAIPVLAGVAGNAVGGPLGGMLGGALGGALSSKKHRLDHALGGALLSGLVNAAMPTISSGISTIFGGGNAAAGTNMIGSAGRRSTMATLQGLGKTAGGSGLGGLGGFGGLGGLGGTGGGGFLSGVLNKIKKNPLESALLATAVGGTLMGRQKKNTEPTAQQFAMQQRPEINVAQAKPLKRKYIQTTPYTFDNNAEQLFHEDANPPVETYARGGFVGGAYGGAQDNIKTKIRPGSFVWNATDLSLLGDGNTEKGANEVEEFGEEALKNQGGHLRNSDYMKSNRRPKLLDAYVSSGEYIMEPEVVTAIGKGSNEKGAKLINKGRKRLRKQKGVKDILPPKSKKVSAYFKG